MDLLVIYPLKKRNIVPHNFRFFIILYLDIQINYLIIFQFIISPIHIFTNKWHTFSHIKNIILNQRIRIFCRTDCSPKIIKTNINCKRYYELLPADRTLRSRLHFVCCNYIHMLFPSPESASISHSIPDLISYPLLHCNETAHLYISTAKWLPLPFLHDFLDSNKNYDRLRDSIKENKTPVLATGVVDGQKTHLIAGITNDVHKVKFGYYSFRIKS